MSALTVQKPYEINTFDYFMVQLGQRNTSGAAVLSAPRAMVTRHRRSSDMASIANPRDIPYGYCHCGCGQKTRVAINNDAWNGYVKGRPVQYIKGHSAHIASPFPDPNPSGLCMCRCGRKTSVIRLTNVKLGRYRGHHSRYLNGHCNTFRPNSYQRHDAESIRIILKDGYALVDNDDLPLVILSRWHHSGAYAEGASRAEQGGYTTIYLHRFILQCKSNDIVDHINRDGLDCRRKNLRVVSQAQNAWNSARSIVNTSGFKGVSRVQSNQSWAAWIGVGGKNKRIGSFGSPEEAALAYDRAARELHGEFARLNFPEEGEQKA